MAVLHFLTAILAFLCWPISWIAGLVLGFLFHLEMRKLGWGLLFFVVPSIGSLSASSGGGLYDSMACFMAVSCLAAVSYLFLEQRLYRKVSRGPLP
jgi:hypothetical protein